jgi:hypothetical protein
MIKRIYHTVNSVCIDFFIQYDFVFFDRSEKTASSTCMTGYAILMYLEYNRISITVKEYVFYFLCVMGAFAFFPDALLAPAEVVCIASRESKVICFFIDVGQHEYLRAFMILGNSRDERGFVPVYVQSKVSIRKIVLPL